VDSDSPTTGTMYVPCTDAEVMTMSGTIVEGACSLLPVTMCDGSGAGSWPPGTTWSITDGGNCNIQAPNGSPTTAPNGGSISYGGSPPTMNGECSVGFDAFLTTWTI
jgi:hypothetical protein